MNLLNLNPKPPLRQPVRPHSSHSVKRKAAISGDAVTNQQLMTELAEFLKEDLTHLFDAQGIDTSKYDQEVDFQDPITQYSTLSGYLFNIQMLRRVFSPKFILHDVKQTGPLELTTRWTMSMKPGVNGVNPFSFVWDPTLTFTGTSIMSVNPSTGRFNRHIDTWDAVKDQKYLSFEAVGHLMKQLGDVKKAPPNLASPEYTVLKKKKDYEIRKYDAFPIIETTMKGDGQAFNSLAGYLFGKNETKEKMEMTTPVFNDMAGGRMQFYVDKQEGALPAPTDASVVTKDSPGGTYAVSTFGGLATEGQVKEEEQALRRALELDGISLSSSASKDCLLARYNEPWSNPLTRKNEILIRLENFTLW